MWNAFHPATACTAINLNRSYFAVTIEIERKFLVANDEWRQSAVRSVGIRDGLIAVYEDRKVRVRISGDVATVAIKGPRIGIVRSEFEYEIPIVDAERMLSTMLAERSCCGFLRAFVRGWGFGMAFRERE